MDRFGSFIERSKGIRLLGCIAVKRLKRLSSCEGSMR